MNKQKLLRDLDAIECEMRRLEGRLTSIRAAIYEEMGGVKFSRVGMNGQPREPDAVHEKGSVE